MLIQTTTITAPRTANIGRVIIETLSQSIQWSKIDILALDCKFDRINKLHIAQIKYAIKD